MIHLLVQLDMKRNHETQTWSMLSWWEGCFFERNTCINQLNGNDFIPVNTTFGAASSRDLTEPYFLSSSFSNFFFGFEFFIFAFWQQAIAIFLRYRGKIIHSPCQKRVLQSEEKMFTAVIQLRSAIHISLQKIVHAVIQNIRAAIM